MGRWRPWNRRDGGKGGGGVRNGLGRASMDHKHKETGESRGVFRSGGVCYDMENKLMIYYNQNLGFKPHYGS